MIRPGGATRARWAVVMRVLGGTLGAYGLTSLTTAALALALATLGMDRVEAVYATSLASFALFAVIAMAMFHARRVARAWLWMIACAVPAGLTLQLMPGAAS